MLQINKPVSNIKVPNNRKTRKGGGRIQYRSRHLSLMNSRLEPTHTEYMERNKLYVRIDMDHYLSIYLNSMFKRFQRFIDSKLLVQLLYS